MSSCLENHPIARNFLIGAAVLIYLVAMLYFVNHGGIGQGDFQQGFDQLMEFSELANDAGMEAVQVEIPADGTMTLGEIQDLHVDYDGLSETQLEQYNAGKDQFIQDYDTRNPTAEFRADGTVTDGTVTEGTDTDGTEGTNTEGTETDETLTNAEDSALYFEDFSEKLMAGDDRDGAYSKKAMFGLAGGAGLLSGYYFMKSVCTQKMKGNFWVWILVTALFFVLGGLGASGIGRNGAIVLQVVLGAAIGAYAISKAIIIPVCQITGNTKLKEYESNGYLKAEGTHTGRLARMINLIEGNKEESTTLSGASPALPPTPPPALEQDAKPVKAVGKPAQHGRFAQPLRIEIGDDGRPAYARPASFNLDDQAAPVRRRLVTMDTILASTQF